MRQSAVFFVVVFLTGLLFRSLFEKKSEFVDASADHVHASNDAFFY